MPQGRGIKMAFVLAIVGHFVLGARIEDFRSTHLVQVAVQSGTYGFAAC